jgi:hypothetical protein
MVKESQAQKFRELAAKYNLTKDDFWKAPQGFVVITRSGVERIQAKVIETYDINLEACREFTNVEKSCYCVRAEARHKENGQYIVTFGESSPANTKNSYPVAMAEKRALARIVLKVSDLYKLNIYSEDEME